MSKPYTYDHNTRRDNLMHAARVLKRAIDRTRDRTGHPRQRWATPGTVEAMRECVRQARLENYLAIEERRYHAAAKQGNYLTVKDMRFALDDI